MVLLIALSGGLIGCATRRVPEAQTAPAAAPVVAGALATRGTIVATRDLGGFIAPAQNVLITSSLTEPAAAVNVVEGQRVRKGDVLATFDAADLRAQYQADLHAALAADANASKQVFAGAQTIGTGQSGVATAASALAQAQQKLQLDETNLARDRQLLANGYISQQTVDAQAQMVAGDSAVAGAAQSALNSARVTANANGTQDSGLQGASIQSLREAAAQAHAVAEQTAAQIARATLYAPVDGVVTNRNLNPGEYPGSRTLFTIQALSTVYAQLNASSEQLAGTRVGNIVTVRLHGGTTSKQGRIAAILGQAAPGSTNFTIKVALDNTAGLFLAGMAVDARLSLNPVTGTQIPRTAFTGGTETSVGTITAGGTYHSTPVRVLAETADTAIVAGIPPGTRIVIDGTQLADGQKVALR
jgi:multidrug efflux pump subunit AcrA (membrane-fusion protein)